jgi:hypothetical protein
MLDHDYLVVVAPAMIAMPTVIAMLTEFGARVHMVAVAMLDHNGLSTRNRRRRNGNRAKRGDNVSKLLHVALLHGVRIKHRKTPERSAGTARES